MEKTQEILKHIFELYQENEPADEDVIRWCEKNIERYKAWEEAFIEYDMLDVFRAIDIYWRYTSDKTKPTVAKLLAMLSTEKEVKKERRCESTGGKYFNIENQYMQRDKALGINQEYFLADYRRAVDYILNDLLREKIGNFEYSKLSKDDKVDELSEKYALAMRNGLFNEFDDVLRMLNPKDFNGGKGTIKDLKSAWSF
jgi:hypothetical protein